MSAQLEMLVRSAEVQRLLHVPDPQAEDRARATHAKQVLDGDEKLAEAAGSETWVLREARLHLDLVVDPSFDPMRAPLSDLVRGWVAACGLSEPTGAEEGSKRVAEAITYLVRNKALHAKETLTAAMTSRAEVIMGSLASTHTRARQENLRDFTKRTSGQPSGNVVDLRPPRPVPRRASGAPVGQPPARP